MKESVFDRRKRRNRFALKKKANGRPRLSVHRTNLHIYAQIIDDTNGVTVASASTNEAGVLGELKHGGNVAAAQAVGTAIAERAKAAGVEQVVFDRGGFIYHGRIKALADAAREGGLRF
jgi:large subunit ribosomal protein L18